MNDRKPLSLAQLTAALAEWLGTGAQPASRAS